jgi:hypothetical protein
MTTERMRFGEKSFHELNILDEVCSCAGVRGAGKGSRADTGGCTDNGRGTAGAAGRDAGEVDDRGGGGSSSSRHADNRAIKSAFASAADGAHDDDAAWSPSAASSTASPSPPACNRPSKLHCRRVGAGSGTVGADEM